MVPNSEFEPGNVTLTGVVKTSILQDRFTRTKREGREGTAFLWESRSGRIWKCIAAEPHKIATDSNVFCACVMSRLLTTILNAFSSYLMKQLFWNDMLKIPWAIKNRTASMGCFSHMPSFFGVISGPGGDNFRFLVFFPCFSCLSLFPLDILNFLETCS